MADELEDAEDSRIASQGFKEKLQVHILPLFLHSLKSLSSHLCLFIKVILCSRCTFICRPWNLHL